MDKKGARETWNTPTTILVRDQGDSTELERGGAHLGE